jgi:large conductance mechanosensitive channel
MEKVRNLWAEFKAFAFKGNLIDLAVAVVIGTAFGKVVDAIVKGLIMPIATLPITLIGLKGYELWEFKGIRYGLVLAELINFLLVALAVFIVIVKVMGAMARRVAPPKASEPTTKECPFCLSMIPLKATVCGHCTKELPAAQGAPAVA